MLFRNYHTAQQRECISVKNPDVVNEWMKQNKPWMLKAKEPKRLVTPKKPVKSIPKPEPKHKSPETTKRVQYGTQHCYALQLLKKGVVRGDGFKDEIDRRRFYNAVCALRAKGYNVTTKYESIKGVGRVGLWTLINEQ